MRTVGHLLQVLHIGQALGIFFLVTYLPGPYGESVGIAWMALVCWGFVLLGKCPFTLVANYCFRRVGAPEYDGLREWLEGAFGTAVPKWAMAGGCMLAWVVSTTSGYLLR